ncbi:predicted protein [Nematostella vectensis]|uniref:Uncharacterized protein n=1 Tax=Nematostella vectensis TaxID=45351 RepID=A7T054_NEMVE|nr:predicted protein [Nematostella vectensis]|eukprot:XP_001622753.1 predicted protein [Nematostella vectensis]
MPFYTTNHIYYHNFREGHKGSLFCIQVLLAPDPKGILLRLATTTNLQNGGDKFILNPPITRALDYSIPSQIQRKMSKSRRGKSASTNEISRWEQELLQAPFNEDSWKSSVVFTAPNSVDDNIFLDILSDVIATGLRKLFSVITYDGLIKDAREYGKPQTGGGKGKGAASSKPPPFHEVCEPVKALVDQGEPIPPALMAKLLKFKLLHIKQKDFDRREEERKAAKAAESGKKDEKGGKKSHSPSGKRSKSPGKVKKGKKGESDMPPSPKKESKLKKRGDVEDTFKTIDDEPDENGSPQHYVIIHGVLMAPVLQHLSDIGISVDAIIRVKAESYERFKAKPVKDDADKLAEVPEGEAVDAALHAEDAAAKRKEAEKLLETFWAESDSIVLKAPSGHRLKDIAKYEVVVKDRTVPEEGLDTLDGDKRVSI